MLTENQIFALRQLQGKDVAKPTFYRVLTKTNCYGLSLGTPFIASAASFQELSRLNQMDYDPAMVIMNPCPVGKEYKPNTLAEVSYASLSVSSEPTFLDVHFIKEADNAAKDFNDAFNHALAGGAATVFFKDTAAAKEVLTQILPDIFNKYAYTGTFKAGFMSPTEKTVLMVQFFHPKHCCAVYYPAKVDGVLISISAVMLEASIANDQIERPMYINLFVSNFLDNILTLDGSKIAMADSIGNSYFKMIEVCISSMTQPIKQSKKSTQIVFKRPTAGPIVAPPMPNEEHVKAKIPKPSAILGSVLESRLKEAVRDGLNDVDVVTSSRYTEAAPNNALWTYNDLLKGNVAQTAPPPPMEKQYLFEKNTTVDVIAPIESGYDDGNVFVKDDHPAVLTPIVVEKTKRSKPKEHKTGRQEYKAGRGTSASAYYIDEPDTSTSMSADMAKGLVEINVAGKFVNKTVTSEENSVTIQAPVVAAYESDHLDCLDKPTTKRELRANAKTECLREGYGGGSTKKTKAVSTRDEDFWS